MKWGKLTGTKQYYVYRSNKKKSGYKKIATLSASKNKYTNKKLSEKKTYYYKVTAKLSTGKKITSNIKTKVKVRGTYTKGSVYGPQLSSTQQKKIKDYVANFVNKYTDPAMDDYVKVALAHDYICYICSYQEKGWSVNSANTAYGVFKYKKAQCSGYARAFKALCDGMGIGCKYVHASSKAYNPSHQWNMVKVDGKWYLIDVQGNDSSGFDMCFLLGKESLTGYLKQVYVYSKSGMPTLSSKNYDFSKYYK